LISDDLQQSYEELAAMAARLQADDIETLSKRDPFFIENKRKVVVLLASYLKLAVAVTRYRGYLNSVDEEAIKVDIERLTGELESASEKIQKVKKKNISVLAERLDKVEKAKANSEYLGAQMETIEDTMSLVVDQAITLSDPKGMGTQIDNLLLNLKETELIAAEMESFSELEEGLDDEVFVLPRREKE
jgi:predicted RNase H-like nuclease (RuvC/YqgF family)